MSTEVTPRCLMQRNLRYLGMWKRVTYRTLHDLIEIQIDQKKAHWLSITIWLTLKGKRLFGSQKNKTVKFQAATSSSSCLIWFARPHLFPSTLCLLSQIALSASKKTAWTCKKSLTCSSWLALPSTVLTLLTSSSQTQLNINTLRVLAVKNKLEKAGFMLSR